MAADWKMVRVRAETVAALEEVRESLLRAEETGRVQLERDLRDRVGLDSVIRILIARHKQHAERRKKSAKRKRPSKPAAEVQE